MNHGIFFVHASILLLWPAAACALLIGFIAVMTALQIIVAAVAYFDLQHVLDNDQREHAVVQVLKSTI